MSRARRLPQNFNSMKTQSKNKKSSARRTAKGVGSGRLVRRLKRIVTEGGEFPYNSATRCLDVVEHVFGAHRRMCDNLQSCVQKHELGLGGEPVDEIVCANVEELLNGNPPPMAEIDARIKAHTQPDGEVIEMALCEAGRLMLRPNVLYRFTVRDGCKACADAAEPYSPNTRDDRTPRP